MAVGAPAKVLASRTEPQGEIVATEAAVGIALACARCYQCDCACRKPWGGGGGISPPRVGYCGANGLVGGFQRCEQANKPAIVLVFAPPVEDQQLTYFSRMGIGDGVLNTACTMGGGERNQFCVGNSTWLH